MSKNYCAVKIENINGKYKIIFLNRLNFYLSYCFKQVDNNKFTLL